MKYVYLVMPFMLLGCASTEEYSFSSDENYSEIIFETSMPNWHVSTYISDSEKECEGFQKAGDLFYDAQLRGSGFFGALQKINLLRSDDKISLTKRVPNQKIIQIKAYASINSFSDKILSCTMIEEVKIGHNEKLKANIKLASNQCDMSITDMAGNPKFSSNLICSNFFRYVQKKWNKAIEQSK